jgi:hypothetical protein
MGADREPAPHGKQGVQRRLLTHLEENRALRPVLVPMPCEAD